MINQITEKESGHRQTYAHGVDRLAAIQFRVTDKTPDQIEAQLAIMNTSKNKPAGVIIFEFLNRDSFQVLYNENVLSIDIVLDYIKLFDL